MEYEYMATKTAIKKVVNVISGVNAVLTSTFSEWANSIADTCHDAFGGGEVPAADITAIQDGVTDGASWAGTSSEKARRSEIKALVLAYPMLGTACNAFKREYGELRREHVVKIARLVPSAKNASAAAKAAVQHFNQRSSGGAGRVATLGMGLGIIKNCDQAPKGLTKTKMNAFRRELAALCTKYGISY